MKDNEKENELYCEDAPVWRNWLRNNHNSTGNVWLIIYHMKSKTPSVKYQEAVDEALCYGWIDSKPNKRDGESYYVLFAKRNPKSNWSRVNKEKIARLMKENKMAKPGLEMVEKAKETGTWNALDEIENGVLPKDLMQEFEANQPAYDNWNKFPFSTRRGILEWIINAKKAETRTKRIMETVSLAEKNIRANQYRQPKGK